MENLAKEITLLTLIALVQVVFVAGITEASPFHSTMHKFNFMITGGMP
jgi:uncharacterized membrane protein